MSSTALARSAVALVFAFAVARPGLATASPESSLQRCQRTVQKSSAKLVAKTLKALGTCLKQISAEFHYWTSTTSVGSPLFAWVAIFGPGSVDPDQKISFRFVRAVRGRS